MGANNTMSLRVVYLFEELPEDKLVRIEACCTHRSYRAGEEIVGYLDTDDDVYFVLSGSATVKIYSIQGKVVGFRTVNCGEIFGEFAAIDHGPRSASIEAKEDCEVAVLSGDNFRAFLASEPIISNALLCHLVMQLRVLTTRVFEFSTLSVNARIQTELLRLALDHGHTVPGQPGTVHIENPPTHAELAGRISTHREAVTRHLNYLSRIQLIERAGHALVINDIDRLNQMVLGATGE